MKLLVERSFISCVDVFPLKTEADWDISKVAIRPQGKIFSFYNVLDKNKNFPKLSGQYFGLVYNK